MNENSNYKHINMLRFVANKIPSSGKSFTQLSKNIPQQQCLKQPAAIKYLLRPNIKGPTRGRRNYSTCTSIVVPAISIPKVVTRNYSTLHNSNKKTDSQIVDVFCK